MREWLGIVDPQPLEPLRMAIAELRAEVTRLSVAQYVPPQTPEPERKVIKAQNFRQYLEIIDQEQEALFREEENALR